MGTLLSGDFPREIVLGRGEERPVQDRGRGLGVEGARQNEVARCGFSLVELLVVIVIITILVAIVSPLVPSLLRANQLDASVTTLSGILEEARESALAGNTYVWVGFTNVPAGSPAKGIWVTTLQSADGTETIGAASTATPMTPATPITVPSASLSPNVELHGILQNLSGVQIPTTVPSALAAKAPTNSLQPLATVEWTVPSLATTSAGPGVSVVYAIEFTPNGEAHVPNWCSNIQFALVPSVGPTTNSVLFNISRLTGKTTIYRM